MWNPTGNYKDILNEQCVQFTLIDLKDFLRFGLFQAEKKIQISGKSALFHLHKVFCGLVVFVYGPVGMVLLFAHYTLSDLKRESHIPPSIVDDFLLGSTDCPQTHQNLLGRKYCMWLGKKFNTNIGCLEIVGQKLFFYEEV